MLTSRSAPLLHSDLDYSSLQRSALKTPGKTLKGRSGLQENAFQHGSLTVHPREKKVTIQSPFRQKTGGSKIILQESQPSKGSIAPSQTRPLGDKTPRPNRQSNSLFTPAPRTDKTSKTKLPVLLDVNEDGSTAHPPSAARKSTRTPRISQTFKTPITKGDHWNVSDISIDLGASITEAPGDEDNPDYSEPEYMPPPVPEQPFEPPIEMPDYKVIGPALRFLSPAWARNACDFQLDFVDETDLLKGCEISPEHLLEVPSISDDDEIFGTQMSRTTTSAKSNSKAASTLKPASTRTIGRPLHSTKSSTLLRKPSNTQPPRPATSTSVRRPVPKAPTPTPRLGTSASNAHPRIVSTPSLSNKNPMSSLNQTRAHAKTSDWVDNGADKLAIIDDELPSDVEYFAFEV